MASEAILNIYPYPLTNPTITGNGYTLTPSVGNNCYYFSGIPAGTWTVSADGYNSSTVTVTGTSYTDAYSVTLTAIQYVSKLSNGTAIYDIKDANAYHEGDLATVATSGSYADLSNKPTIDQTYNASSANAQSGTAVASAVSTKQATLVSGTNIKTVNNQSLLGSGNITIQSGGTTDYDELDNRPSINGITLSGSNTGATLGLQDALVSGTNIKTVNSTSLLGSGDISIIGLPSQTGQSGKYLTTDGTNASWATSPGSGASYDSTNKRLVL